MVAPGPRFHDGEGEATGNMLRVAASLVEEGRNGVLVKFGAVDGDEVVGRAAVGTETVEGNEVVGRAAGGTVGADVAAGADV